MLHRIYYQFLKEKLKILDLLHQNYQKRGQYSVENPKNTDYNFLKRVENKEYL